MDSENNPQKIQQESTAPILQIRLPKKLLYISIAVIIICILGFFFFFRSKPIPDGKTPIATVNDQPIYYAYVEKEKELYPGKETEQIEKALTQKVIDDQIILEAAKKEGMIKNFLNKPTFTTEQYLQRTKQVQDVKDTINSKSYGLTVAIVSIWFHNQGPAKIGYPEAKKVAYTKLSALYNKVKKKEITIREAGQLIASDTTLADLDKAYRENSYTVIQANPNEAMTFWPEFDEMLRKLPQGGITPIFTGTDTNKKGDKVIPILYAFGEVLNKTANASKDFDAWFTQYKENAKISYE